MKNLLLVCLFVFVCGCAPPKEEELIKEMAGYEAYEVKLVTATIVKVGKVLPQSQLTQVTFLVDPKKVGNALTSEKVSVGQKVILVGIEYRRHPGILDHCYFAVSPEE